VKVPTAAQAEAAGQRRGEALNEAYAKLGYPVGLTTPYDSDPQPDPSQKGNVPGSAQQDWSSYLGLYGLPADVLKEINAIFAKTPDINQAVVIAQAYVRGTPWYGTTYPGIQEAMAKGIVRDEADYRAKMNDFNGLYRQYTNRDITGAEYADHLREGVDSTTVGRRFQGAAIADTYGQDWNYYEGNFGEGRLTGDEQTALGRQQAGLDSPLGLKVQRRLQMAQERVQKVFSGQLAQGQLSLLNRPDGPADIGR
jgi:hypothetical protein